MSDFQWWDAILLYHLKTGTFHNRPLFDNKQDLFASGFKTCGTGYLGPQNL